VTIGKRHLYVALGLLLLGMLYNLWACRHPRALSRGGGEPPLLSVVQAAPRAEPGAERLDFRAVPAPPPVDLGTPPVWTRDPFFAEREAPRQVKPASDQPADAPAPLVSSILFSPDRKLAIVNGRIVRVGDRLPAGEIVDILRDAVVLKTPSGATRLVPLAGGPIGREP
jgi:hypothetical protein